MNRVVRSGSGSDQNTRIRRLNPGLIKIGRCEGKNDKVKYCVLMCGDDSDIEVVRAASGALAMLTEVGTGWSISYRKYILQSTKPAQYRYAKLQYRFAVTSG